jgi:glycosyltransferase involved in cell wall biosynthesis
VKKLDRRQQLRPVALSLVICTRNRAPQLRQCFDSLKRLTCRERWELILVDNGSTDTTSAVIRDFAADGHVPVITVYEPRPGLGRARNAGLTHATGRIIAFTDDDCYPMPDYLDRIIGLFESLEIGFMGGAIHLFDEADAPLTISLIAEDRLMGPGSFFWPGLIQGANMAFLRETLTSIGGFDDELGPGTPFVADDIDAIGRASAAGWHGGFFTRPVVLHHHGRKVEQGKALSRDYDRGRGAYFMKLLLIPQTRRQVGWRVVAELCQSAIRTPASLSRELRGAFGYFRRYRALRLGARHTALIDERASR